jgi:arylsulfatase A-like enzyme
VKRRLVLAAVLLLAGCDPKPPAPTPRSARSAGGIDRWNVLLLTVDTLRADHLGVYGYRRPTSPRIDAFAREAVVFDRAYSFWPKTRGSFAALLTGRRDSQTGYGKTHPVLLGFNPTLASVLQGAGYTTAAVIDNGNLARENGYAKGFQTYREVWEEKGLETEADRGRRITETGLQLVRGADPARPFFLWLHYVHPHAPYTPPPPFDTAFMDAEARQGPPLPVVHDFHGGVPKRLAVAGQDRLGYYVAQYDGEVAAADQEVGRVLDGLRSSGLLARTLVLLTSDHGESLGEHGYYFDHGEDVFEPSLRIPFVLSWPGGPKGARTTAPVSTLDIVPTVLDAVKVSYPPDLAGSSVLALAGGGPPVRERLFARNDRNLAASWTGRFKVIATPDERGRRLALYDRRDDPGERRDLSAIRHDDLRRERREIELFLERWDKEWARTRGLVGEPPAGNRMSAEACESLRALGYVVAECEASESKPR